MLIRIRETNVVIICIADVACIVIAEVLIPLVINSIPERIVGFKIVMNRPLPG